MMALCWLLAVSAHVRAEAPGRGAGMTSSSDVRISWIPADPAQGDVLQLLVDLPEGMEVGRGALDTHTLHFEPLKAVPGGKWQALHGIDAEQEPGATELSLWIRPREGGRDHGETAPGRTVATDIPNARGPIRRPQTCPKTPMKCSACRAALPRKISKRPIRSLPPSITRTKSTTWQKNSGPWLKSGSKKSRRPTMPSGAADRTGRLPTPLMTPSDAARPGGPRAIRRHPR